MSLSVGTNRVKRRRWYCCMNGDSRTYLTQSSTPRSRTRTLTPCCAAKAETPALPIARRTSSELAPADFGRTPERARPTAFDATEPSFANTGARTAPIAAAVTNAIFAATGVRVRDLPITRDRLIAAMEAGADEDA